MKGKGKSMIPSAEADIAHYGDNGKRRKLAVASKSLTLRYMDSKAILSLELLEDKFIKILVEFYRTADPELHYFSLFQYLKLPVVKGEQKVYHHRIDTKEALALLFFLTKIRDGSKANPDSQLVDLVEILYSFEIKETEVHPQLLQEFQERREEINNKVYHCRKAIKEILMKRKETIQKNFQYSEDNIKLNILESRLKQLSLDLFKKEVIGLRQTGQNQVEIIFQQCYPSKRCTINYLKGKIGEDLYLQKKISFVKTMNISEKKGLNNTNLIICHLCKSLIKEEYVRCNESNMAIINVNHNNSPHVYYKRLIAFDYRYDSYDPPSLDDELNYFKYNQLPIGRTFCNRLFCLSCLSRVSKVEKITEITKHKCDFCRKVCTCESCSIAYQLVQGLAYYRDILEKNYQSVDQFKNLVNYINFNDTENEILKDDIYLRTGFRNSGKQEYTLSYHRYMDRFQTIYKGILKYREMICISNEEKANPSIIFSPEMLKIAAFFDDLKVEAQKKSGQSFLEIKNLREQTKQKLKDFQESTSIKGKIDSNPDVHNILQKFCVTNSEPRQLPDYGITEEEKLDMQNQLEKELEPADERSAQNMIYAKSAIPFDEEDYENMHVSNEYKLITERQIQFEYLVKQGIFHEVTDQDYVPQNYQYSTYYENIYDYFRSEDKEEILEHQQNRVDPLQSHQEEVPEKSEKILQEEMSSSYLDGQREIQQNHSAQQSEDEEGQKREWSNLVDLRKND